LDILLRRSQIDLEQLEAILSRLFIIHRVRGRFSERIEGRLREDIFAEVGVRQMVSVNVPFADREEEGLVKGFFSRFPPALFRVRLTNLDVKSLLRVIGEFQELEVDIGFVESRAEGGSRSPFSGGEGFRWPADEESQIEVAKHLHRAYFLQAHKTAFVDLDFFILSYRSIFRRKLRTISLVAVLSLVCANLMYHVNFQISSQGLTLLVARHWELPLAAGLMSFLTFFNLMQLSLYERLVEIGTIRAVGAETTTTLLIFATEGMFIGGLGAAFGYVILVCVNLVIKYGGMNAALDIAAASGPGKAFLGLFLGVTIGLIGTVVPIFSLIWMPPEKCLAGHK
jgi:hypothetical protein